MSIELECFKCINSRLDENDKGFRIRCSSSRMTREEKAEYLPRFGRGCPCFGKVLERSEKKMVNEKDEAKENESFLSRALDVFCDMSSECENFIVVVLSLILVLIGCCYLRNGVKNSKYTDYNCTVACIKGGYSGNHIRFISNGKVRSFSVDSLIIDESTYYRDYEFWFCNDELHLTEEDYLFLIDSEKEVFINDGK